MGQLTEYFKANLHTLDILSVLLSSTFSFILYVVKVLLCFYFMTHFYSVVFLCTMQTLLFLLSKTFILVLCFALKSRSLPQCILGMK